MSRTNDVSGSSHDLSFPFHPLSLVTRSWSLEKDKGSFSTCSYLLYILYIVKNCIFLSGFQKVCLFMMMEAVQAILNVLSYRVSFFRGANI